MVFEDAPVLQVIRMLDSSSSSGKLPKLDLTESPRLDLSSKPNKKLSLFLLLAVAIFVLAAAGSAVFAYFYFFANKAQPVVILPDPRDSSTVKKVDWIAPTVPANYILHNENSDFAMTAVYQDDAAGCRIVATVEPFKDLPQPSGELYYIKDVDSTHEYEFESATETTDVNAANVDIDKMQGIKVYKQFNYQLASLTYSCKAQVWESKKQELSEIIKQFMVKTERAT